MRLEYSALSPLFIQLGKHRDEMRLMGLNQVCDLSGAEIRGKLNFNVTA